MKTTLIIFFFIVLSKLCIAQQIKHVIDYQYYRDEKTYYAFELYKNASSFDNQLMLNFVSNEIFKKIDKIYLKEGINEFKLRFKGREEVVKSDNLEYKFYLISFSLKDLEQIKRGHKIQIIFKLDNGSAFTLPFNAIKISKLLAEN